MERPGVKEVATFEKGIAAPAVDIVPNHGVSHPGEVNPNLMRSPRVRMSLHEGV